MDPRDIAVHVYFHQVGRTNFVEPEAVRIDQKMVFRAGYTDGGVSPDQFGPAQMIDDAIGGRELNAKIPFGGSDSGRLAHNR